MRWGLHVRNDDLVFMSRDLIYKACLVVCRALFSWKCPHGQLMWMENPGSAKRGSSKLSYTSWTRMFGDLDVSNSSERRSMSCFHHCGLPE